MRDTRNLLIALIMLFGLCILAAAAGKDARPARAGAPIPGLTKAQLAFFNAGKRNFSEIDSVTGSVPGTGEGLGPRFNSNSCASCHSYPALGGTSPRQNPLYGVYRDQGATNSMPWFVQDDGPVRVARFAYRSDGVTRDGGVHNLFVISGRQDAPGCNLAQPDFEAAAAANNLALRIPSPAFGDGLIEAIPDSAILANLRSQRPQKRALGIFGHPNRNGNDGTISRFGWKAQNKSILMMVAEAYNVEVGVTNELFPTERDQTPACQFNGTPEDETNFDLQGTQLPSDIERLQYFVRFLGPPRPAAITPDTVNGSIQFYETGCALCHTPSLATGNSSVAALSQVQVNLYSDLLVHHMGPGLADNIVQGSAGPDEFRTAPLWGLGHRLFFLHDGRSKDLLDAIEQHYSLGNGQYPDSEANQVIRRFNALSEKNREDILRFLRSL